MWSLLRVSIKKNLQNIHKHALADSPQKSILQKYVQYMSVYVCRYDLNCVYDVCP